MPEDRDPAEVLNVPEALVPRRSVDTRDPRVGHDGFLWLDEFIWGHRLWDQSSAWLIFMEFLSVIEGLSADDLTAFADEAPYPMGFRPAQRMYLRNLLFQSEGALDTARKMSPGHGLDTFIQTMNGVAQGLPDTPDFAYLQRHFADIEQLRETLMLLRDSRVEGESNKRWSSKFVFPFGRHAIYEDVHVKGESSEPSREYIVFGRTGELLYMMLTRSAERNELARMADKMMSGVGEWDKLTRLLEPSGQDNRAQRTRSGSYLPYREHPIFDALARDWLAVDTLQLPGYDAYPHLVHLAGLHLLQYFLAIAGGWAGKSDGLRGPAIVCEIIAPKKTPVRDLAIESFGNNDLLSMLAVTRAVDDIAKMPAWQAAVEAGGDEHYQLLAATLRWDEGSAGATPESLIKNLSEEARRRHKKHLGNFHRVIGRNIGLISRRGTNRFRYAPTDALIKTLLLTTVPQRMEFGEFLATLHARYGIVIGPVEAEKELPATRFDQKTLKDNARRLEDRLASLGLLRRLSDACAYVINPYWDVTGSGKGAVAHG